MKGKAVEQAAAEFGLDGARIEQHRVPDTVIAVGGELIENLVGCSAEQALPNHRQRRCGDVGEHRCLVE